MKKTVLSLFAVAMLTMLPGFAAAEAQPRINAQSTTEERTGSQVNTSKYTPKKEDGQIGTDSVVTGDYGTSSLYWSQGAGVFIWEVDTVFVDPFDYELSIDIYTNDRNKNFIMSIPIDGYGIGSAGDQVGYPRVLAKGQYYAELTGTLDFVHGTSYLGDEDGFYAGTTFEVK